MVAQAQLGLVQPSLDGTVTLPGPDGKPVKIPQAALAAAAPSVIPNMTAGKPYLHETPTNLNYMIAKVDIKNLRNALLIFLQRHMLVQTAFTTFSRLF